VAKSPAPALERGLKLIELINLKEELTFSQLEEESGINTSSLNRILKVLRNKGYIHKNSQGNYELGPKLYLFAQGKSVWKMLISKVSPVLHDISVRFEVTTLLLAFLSNNEITVLDKVVSPTNIAMRKVGEEKDDYISSPWGFLFLAELEASAREEFIKKNRDTYHCNIKPLPDDKLQKLIKETQKQGYADDKGLVYDNVRRLAVPVYGKRDQIIAAIGVGTFASLFDEKGFEQLGDYMKENVYNGTEIFYKF
jgi:DNA-binding IclR family transcriptional regulator